jgi:hypothetical protein
MFTEGAGEELSKRANNASHPSPFKLGVIVGTATQAELCNQQLWLVFVIMSVCIDYIYWSTIATHLERAHLGMLTWFDQGRKKDGNPSQARRDK